MKQICFILVLLAFQTAFSQWEPLNNGLYGGTINAIISTEGALLAGTKGAIFRSTDGGENWTKIKIFNGKVNAFLKRQGKILAATDLGLFVTSDNGIKWEEVFGQRMPFTSLVSNDGVLYGGSNINGMYRSTDEGATWQEINSGLQTRGVRDILLTDEYVIIGTDDGAYLSSNRGDSWAKSTSTFGSYYSVDDLAISNGKIFAGVGSGFLVSTNGGVSWTKKNMPESVAGVNFFIVNGNEIFAATADGVYSSTDDGENWTTKSKSLTETVKCGVIESGNILFGVESAGIFKSSDNGATWLNKLKGLTSVTINSISGDENKLFVGTSGVGVMLSTDGGQNWQRSVGDPDFIFSTEIFKGNYYAASPWDGIFISTNGGATWIENNNGISNLDIMCFTSNENEIYAGGSEMYKSSDGKNWTNLPSTNYAYSLLSNNGNLYLGNSGACGVYASTDDGVTWKSKNEKLGDIYVYSLGAVGSKIFAGTKSGVYESEDEGNNWTRRSNGLTGVRILDLKSFDNYLFAASGDGVYLTSDEGESWRSVTGNIEDSVITAIKINSQYIYVGTSNNGVYRAKLSEFGIKGTEQSICDNKLRLFPNPAGDYLNISTGNSAPSGAILQVFDMLGNEALSISPNDSEQIKIDIRALSAGTYYLRYGDIGRTFMKY